MSTLWRVADNKLHLAFHPGQAQAWKSERRFTAVIAGTQGGKTAFGPWWLHREIGRGGPGDYLAVSSSFDLFKLRMLPALLETFEHLLRSGRYWAGTRVLELADPVTGRFLADRADQPMWGRLILRSAASGSGLESATAKAAWLDECGQDEFTVETWEAVLRRLALSQGRVLLTTTPYNLGWIKTELYDRWTAGDPNIGVVQFPSVANPAFPAEEFERARATMPAWRFQMFYQGLWSRPHGLIYDCFEPEIHAVADFEIPAAWPRYIGVDFGAVNTALIWVAEDTAVGRFYCYRESLSGGQSTAEHVREAQERAQGENVVAWRGGAKSEEQQRWDWSSAGISVARPGVADVEAGIDRIYGLLREKRLFVFRSCRGLLDEFGSYRRRLDASGQPTEEIEQKRQFHRLDALRYVGPDLTFGRDVGEAVLLSDPRDCYDIQSPLDAGCAGNQWWR